MCRFSDSPFFAAKVCVLDPLKPRHAAAVNGDGFEKHLSRADPQFAGAILLPVDDEFAFCLAVPSDTQHGVFLPLVVSVAAGFGFDRFDHFHDKDSSRCQMATLRTNHHGSIPAPSLRLLEWMCSFPSDYASIFSCRGRRIRAGAWRVGYSRPGSDTTDPYALSRE